MWSDVTEVGVWRGEAEEEVAVYFVAEFAWKVQDG